MTADKITRDTIDTLAGRDDLSREQTLALAEARRATAPLTERIEQSGWTVELSHHVHSHGDWSVGAWLTGTCYQSERCLASGVSEALARRVAAAFLACDGDVRERYQAARAVRLAATE